MTNTLTGVEGARRLHPGTTALRILRSAPSTLLAIPAAFAFFAERGLFWVLPFALGIILLSTVPSYLRWRAFRYAIVGDEFVITDGLVNLSRRSIPLARIQDVSVEQRPLQRLFRLASVKIETGGGDANEAALDSVSMAEATRLRAMLRKPAPSMPADQIVATGPTPESPADEWLHPVFAMGVPRIVFMGLFRFSLVWLAALFAAFQYVDDFVDFRWRDVKAIIAEGQQRFDPATQIWLLGSAAIGLLLLGMASGIIATLLREYGFRLSFGDGRFRRVRGLLTKTEVVVVARRIQLAIIRRGWLSGRLGWRSLVFQTLGGSDDKGGRQDVAPFAREGEIAPILTMAGLPSFDVQVMRPVSRGHIWRTLVRASPAPAAVTIVGFTFQPLAFYVLPFAMLPVVLAIISRRNHRFGRTDGAVQIARGVVVHRRWIVPHRSVQTVTISQGPLQRLFSLATVDVDTAGAPTGQDAAIIDVRLADAATLALDISARARSNRL